MPGYEETNNSIFARSMPGYTPAPANPQPPVQQQIPAQPVQPNAQYQPPVQQQTPAPPVQPNAQYQPPNYQYMPAQPQPQPQPPLQQQPQMQPQQTVPQQAPVQPQPQQMQPQQQGAQFVQRQDLQSQPVDLGYATQYAYQPQQMQAYYPGRAAKPKASTGKIAAIIVAVASGILLLTLALVIFIYKYSQRGLAWIYSNTSASHSSTFSYSFSLDPTISADMDTRHGNLGYSLEYYAYSDYDILKKDGPNRLKDDPYDNSDPNYYDFDTYIDTSVSYKISEYTWEYDNTDGHLDDGGYIYPHGIVASSNYYQLSDTGLKNEDEINRRIYEMTLETFTMAETTLWQINDSYTVDAVDKVYVTYMDDEVISLAFYASSYATNGTDSFTYNTFLRSVNFDLETGFELKATDCFDFSGDFYETFKERCLTQNGSPVDYHTDADLKAILTGDDEIVWFYTPLGLEVGVNRDAYTGWSTCTFTDYSQYVKSY